MASGFANLEIDQALAYHRVSTHKFEISGLRTGSVRDQMLRAMLVTEGLIAGGCIDDTSPLLVVGGGVAGVTAALAAASWGVSVTLLEIRDGPLRTQMVASSRYLDPVEFDWPQPHWNGASTPWGMGVLPLHYPPGRADVLAQDWETYFFEWLDLQRRAPNPNLGDIDYYWGVDARKFEIEELQTPAYEGVELYHSGNPAQRFYFGAAISCIGFAGENVSVGSAGPDFKGYEFWGYDPIDQPDFSLTRHGSDTINVLISGGGDGAQQDFLRVLTGTFGARLYAQLAPDLPKLELLDAVLAEDAARRAHAWRRNGQILQASLQRWNDEYVKIVDQIWTSWSQVQRSRIAANIFRPNVAATWIVGGDVPGFCYGLNRLLALLIARLHAEVTSRSLETARAGGKYSAPGSEVMVLGHWLEKIEHDSKAGTLLAHQCGDATKCLGEPHIATLTGVVEPRPTDSRFVLRPFHLVIVRHGVKQKPLFRKAPVSEQIVPFDIPA